MTKPELITTMQEKLEANEIKLSKKVLIEVANTFMDTIVEAMTKGDKVQLVGFGTFEATEKNERTCRNPQTGDSMVVPAHRAPKLKFSGSVKEAIKNA